MVSVSFQFRTWNANGLLLFSTLADGMLEVVLKDGKVMVHISVLQLKSSQVDLASGMEGLRLTAFILRVYALMFYSAFFCCCCCFLKNVTLLKLASTQRHPQTFIGHSLNLRFLPSQASQSYECCSKRGSMDIYSLVGANNKNLITFFEQQ